MIKPDFKSIVNPEEKQFLKQLTAMQEGAENRNKVSFTGFYNAQWMQGLCRKYFGTPCLKNMYSFGGYKEAERQMIGCSPFPLEERDFPMVCLLITVKTGLGKALSHRDYLGALMGLGIERDKLGEVIIKPFGAYVMATLPMAEYIELSLNTVGKYQNVTVQAIPFEQMEINPPETQLVEKTVASLRVDAVLAAGFNLSRSLCTKLIEADKAKCNGLSVKVSTLLNEGDCLTLRGYGKIKLQVVQGATKKDRIRITLQKYV